MNFVHKNLRFLRLQYGLTQKELAAELGVKTPVIGAYEEERATPPLECLIDMSTYFGVSLDAFGRRDLSSLPEKQWRDKDWDRGNQVLAITVDAQDKENVELVSQKAAAGYLNGFQDPEYLAELPRMQLPMLSGNATYRAFEIRGDSMLPLPSGTIVFGVYVDRLGDVTNGKRYVVVTKEEGIVFKRVYNLAKTERKLLLVSDNKQHDPFVIDARDVLELWEARAFFSHHFPESEEAPGPLADQLALQLVKAKRRS